MRNSTKTLSKPVIEISVLDKNLELTTRPAEFFIQDGNLMCCDIDAREYDCEIRGSLWIAPSLVEWAEKNNGYWEWENAEVISFAPNDEVTFTE
tara:strand:+ start:2621 stop:2902 length:282 start_codon:yes stop_codon:yes gene_type:complete